jgi:hypothetical protein
MLLCWEEKKNLHKQKMNREIALAVLVLFINFQLFLFGSSKSSLKSGSECVDLIIDHTNDSVAEKISLFGNGKWHTLVILYYNSSGKHRLLETVGHDGRITINDRVANSEHGVLDMRSQPLKSVQRWGESTHVNCTDRTIAQVINAYQCTKYIPFGLVPFQRPRNCRTFVNSIFKSCGSSRKTGSNPYIEWWMLIVFQTRLNIKLIRLSYINRKQKIYSIKFFDN